MSVKVTITVETEGEPLATTIVFVGKNSADNPLYYTEHVAKEISRGRKELTDRLRNIYGEPPEEYRDKRVEY